MNEENWVETTKMMNGSNVKYRRRRKLKSRKKSPDRQRRGMKSSNKRREMTRKSRKLPHCCHWKTGHRKKLLSVSIN